MNPARHSHDERGISVKLRPTRFAKRLFITFGIVGISLLILL